MAEAILITVSDVATYREIDTKWPAARFAAFANDIQRKNLRGLLGDALYYAFMDDTRAAGIYKELLDGKTYSYEGNTIQYYGLKPVLCYWWLAIAARESDLFQSSWGAIQLTNNPQQNFETSREKERLAAGYMETAQGYANDVIKFLSENSASYPLWDGESETNPTEFISFRV